MALYPNWPYISIGPVSQIAVYPDWLCVLTGRVSQLRPKCLSCVPNGCVSRGVVDVKTILQQQRRALWGLSKILLYKNSLRHLRFTACKSFCRALAIWHTQNPPQCLALFFFNYLRYKKRIYYYYKSI